ncbi:MAG: DUF3604 domain-containing protein [Verrucomicrobia bacterium]|nr:DUF3604 domain-containing protein [Verrucomicrobiota bacterium]
MDTSSRAVQKPRTKAGSGFQLDPCGELDADNIIIKFNTGEYYKEDSVMRHSFFKFQLVSILFTAFLLAGCGGGEGGPSSSSTTKDTGDSYLEPSLRAQVQQLKSDVKSTPTNPSNVQKRAKVLLDWGNAFSLAKGPIPDELTLTTAVGIYSNEAAQRGRMVYRYMDSNIHELSLREADPNAIGSLRSSTSGPFPADGYATFEMTYTVGSQGMHEGGGILVAKHALSNYRQSQSENPAADNYVTIKSSNSQARFTKDTHPVVGMYGGFRSLDPAPVFRLEGTDLQAGETVTVTYGDTSGGSPGYRMQNYSNNRAAFPLFVDLDGSDRFLTLPIQAIRVSGTDVAGVHGFVPSIVTPGEQFTMSVRFQDRFANLAQPPFPDFEILLNGELFRTVNNVSEGIVLFNDLEFTKPGIYRFSFRAGDIEGIANPILVQNNPTNRIYWGDTHGHSGMAEGAGTADGYMRFARDEARLDYVTHSEHDIWLDDREWETLKENIVKYFEPGVFIPFLGYEWSQSNVYGGHHNVLFRTPEDRVRIPRQTYPTLSQLYNGLRNNHDTEDVVIIPHAHQNGEYRQSDPEMEHLVEIMSGHGTFEWFGRMYLRHGHQVGFIAASDDHLGHPGYSAPRSSGIAQRGGLGALMAPEKSRDALFDAMKSLYTYATTGDRIILNTEVNGARMGSRTDYSEKRIIKGRVIGTAPIDTISVIKNEKEIWTKNYLTPVTEVDGPQNLQLTFYSDSDPYHPRDNPRGWRNWNGSLEVKGGKLLEASPTDHVNPNYQSFKIDENNANLVHFRSLTRGDASSINLVVDDVDQDTMVSVSLNAANETGGAPQVFRRHGRTPAWNINFALDHLNDHHLEETQEFQAWTDSVTLRRITDQGVMEAEFEITDNESPRQGDYYFVRVKQANDAYAWSSPTWVGGFGPK